MATGRPSPGPPPVGSRLVRRTAEALVARCAAEVERLADEAVAGLLAEDPTREPTKRVYTVRDLLTPVGYARSPGDRGIALGHVHWWTAGGQPAGFTIGVEWDSGEVRVNR